ncbi:unnamed protein product [Aphanomyces euteiches]
MKITAILAAVASSLALVQGQVAVWGQCGGQGYTGSTVCASGSVCTKQSDFYSQCIPSANVPSTGPTTAPTTKPSTGPTTVPTPQPSASSPSPPSSKSIYFGTAEDTPTKYGTIIPDNFNLLVAGNGMKWDAHERSKGVFDFSTSLKLIAYAKQNGMKMRGHCLVWHNQMPRFYCSNFVNNGCTATTLTSAQLLQVIETRMQKTFAALNDPTIIAWDALNEAVTDDGSGLKRDIFTLARKYAPAGVKLFYNDYGCDTPGAKANQCFELVKGLKDKGLIDGMGVPAFEETAFQRKCVWLTGATDDLFDHNSSTMRFHL